MNDDDEEEEEEKQARSKERVVGAAEQQAASDIFLFFPLSQTREGKGASFLHSFSLLRLNSLRTPSLPDGSRRVRSHAVASSAAAA